MRFPDGGSEYRSEAEIELNVGSRVRARGCTWRVTKLEPNSVFLERVDDEPAGGLPSSLPMPLGDDPLTVEVLSEV